LPNRKSLLFVPLTKVDYEQRLVYGRAADETPDDVREIFDYASSKPYFEKWSATMAKATEAAGQEQSLGNVRAMHGKVVAGKLTQITFDDTQKAIDICAKILDDNEWEKVAGGAYTGFSIGGTYGRVWSDPAQPAHKRYTAKPAEISIVDLPSNPSATFALVKAGGVVEDTFFKIAERSDTSPNEGEHKYGDVEYADPTNNKYPIDDEEHIRAAWSYINHADNAGKYSAADVASIKRKIIAAWKDKIDKDGPPSAEAKKAAGAHIQAEDLMDATVEQLTDALTKKMSAAHKDRVQAIHDHAAAMGADCDDGDETTKAAKAELQKRGDELVKVTGERDAALTKVAALEKRVAELEAAPGPAKGAVVELTKEQEMAKARAAEEEKPLDPKDPNYAQELTKRALRQGRAIDIRELHR